MKQFYVYIHTSPSEKIYIGITSMNPPEKRFENGRGYGKRTVFGKAIKKYGWDNFKHEIIESGLTEKQAKAREKELICQHKSNDREFGYNMSAGGDGTLGVKPNEEQREAIRQRNTGTGNPFYGRKHTEQSRQKIKESHADFKGENHPGWGKKMSESARRHMSENHADIRGENNPNYGKGKPVLQIDLKSGVIINTYKNLRSAARETGSNEVAVGHCCRGRSKTSNGYAWKYA